MRTDALPGVVLHDPARVRLVGLDGEMSAASLADGGRLIQAGLALRSGSGVEVFSSLIGWADAPMLWEDRAAAVHGIERRRLDDAPAPHEVDRAASAFLTERALAGPREEGVPRVTLVTVGFNVAAFDHPFFRHALPLTTSLLSRRAVDLNALCFALDGWDPDPKVASPRTWSGWKRTSKRYANARLAAEGHAGGEHDAGWDAAQALYVLEYLRAHIHASRTYGPPAGALPS